MRTEMKIGIIAALVIAAGSIYFFYRQARQGGGDTANVLPVEKPVPNVGNGPDGAPPAQLASDERPARPDQSRPRSVENRRPTTPAGDPRVAANRPATGRDNPAERPRSGMANEPTGPTASDDERTTAGPNEQPTTRPSLGLLPLDPIVTPVGPRSDTTDRPVPAPEPEPTRAPIMPPPSRIERPDARVQKHTVVELDTLWGIAEQYYGNGALYKRLIEANPQLENPDRLPVGEEITVPPKEGEITTRGTRKPTERTAEPTPSAAERAQPATRKHVYVVEKGDSLISIARNVLEDGNRWREIWDLNKDAIPNPDVLTIGTELKLPAK
jgi:nucleoid-associated protein YgaU